jgi:predicted nucleic acid-binding protein
MRPLVLDASAGLAIVREEPEREAARRIVTGRTGQLPVPAIFWLEVVNSLTRRHRGPADIVLRAVYDLDQLGVQEIAPDRVALLSVIDVVDRHRLSAFDASYLALAISVDGDLLTLDRRLADAAGSRAIYVGSDTRMSEAPVPYGSATWPKWPGAAAYLQQLRAEVLAERPIKAG